MNSHQLVVVGGGPAGYAAALYGAGLGLDTALVEKFKAGGTCLHVGCIPAKELLETAAMFRSVGEAAEFGIQTSVPSIDMAAAQRRKQGIIDRLTSGLEGLLKRRKITVYSGVGRLLEDRRVEVRPPGGEAAPVVLSGEHVVLATGSVPRGLEGFDVDGRRVVTSDELLSLSAVPRSAVVVGGGAIGCEFASLLSDLGSEVTVLEALPRLLFNADEEVSRLIERSFRKRGIAVETGVKVLGCDSTSEGAEVTLDGKDSEQADLVVLSVGRRPFTEGLGLEEAFVETDDRGFVATDEFCRTSAANVYAVGDLIDTPQLAHVGFAEGILAVRDILGEHPMPLDYAKVPWCIYCRPEVAFAGLTEAAAREAHGEVAVSKHHYASNGRAMILGETEGFVKVVAARNPDGSAGRLLGVHLAGPWATEQLGQGYLAVNWEATAEEAAQFIQPHPTLGELFGETVMSLTGRSLHG